MMQDAWRVKGKQLHTVGGVCDEHVEVCFEPLHTRETKASSAVLQRYSEIVRIIVPALPVYPACMLIIS